MVNNLVQYFIHLPESIITVWTLQLGHLEEDCPVTTFSENKRFSRFFLANGPIKFKVQLCDHLRKQSSDLWMLLVNLRLLFSENVVIQQSFKCPGLSVHTVKNKLFMFYDCLHYYWFNLRIDYTCNIMPVNQASVH